MDSKNIERLFQEKLKDLEISPNPAVWNKIEQSMGQSKKTKKGYIWFLISSVAAVLLIAFYVYKEPKISTNTPLKTSAIQLPMDTVLAANNKVNDTLNSKTQEKFVSINQRKIEALVLNTTSPKNIFSIKNNMTATDTLAVLNSFTYSPVISIQKNLRVSDFNPSKIIGKENIKAPPEYIEAFIKNNILEKQDLTKISVAKTKETKHYWSIAPTISQFFYNTFSNKSTVDPSLNNAKKTGNNTTAYGVKIAYQASKKWRIQTGIHKVDLSQTTQNIALASARRFTSFAYASSNTPVLHLNALSSNIKGVHLVSTPNKFVPKTTKNNNLEQTYSYIEIPFEVNFQVFRTNNIQFHLVGGFSTLFLTQNNLQIQTLNSSYSEGKATNLNNFNFSLNFGTDLEYHFSKKWFLNITPNLKVQTQTFNKATNNPYLLGISSGINYKF